MPIAGGFVKMYTKITTQGGLFRMKEYFHLYTQNINCKLNMVSMNAAGEANLINLLCKFSSDLIAALLLPSRPDLKIMFH